MKVWQFQAHVNNYQERKPALHQCTGELMSLYVPEVGSWQSHDQSHSCYNLSQDGINIWVGWRSGVQEECHQGQWKRFRWGIFRCVKLHNVNSPKFQPPPLAISLDRQHQQQSGGWETRSSMEMTSPMSGSQRNLCQVYYYLFLLWQNLAMCQNLTAQAETKYDFDWLQNNFQYEININKS